MTDLANLTNPDAERSVVAAILLQPDAIAEVAEWLPHEAFHDPKLRAVYRAAKQLWERRVPATHVTVPPELIAMGGKSLEEATDYVLDLAASSVTSVYVAHDARTVMQFAWYRAIAEGGTELVTKAFAAKPFDLDAAWIEVRRSIDHFAEKPATVASAGDQMQVLRETAAARWDGTLVDNVLPLRFRHADRLLGGGLRNGQLMYLAARPGMGKSALMLHLSAYRRAAVFSLEMPWMDVRNRMVTTLAGVPFDVGTRPVGDIVAREKWIDASYQVETWPVEIFDSLRTTAQIEAACLRMQSEDGLDAVFIDHLGLLADDHRRGGEYERVSLISRRLKELAMRLNVPVVCLAQLNRGVEDRTGCVPFMSDLRDSGRIEEDGDVVALLFRRGYYAAKGMVKPDDNEDRIIGTGWDRVEFKIEKNRNGETGTVELGWEGKVMRFHDPETRLAS